MSSRIRRILEDSWRLGNCGMEEALRFWGQEVCCNRSASTGFSEDRHLVWIATECCDVVLHPLKGLHLILEAEVCLSLQCRVRHESQNPKSVVECHIHSALLNEGVRGEVISRPRIQSSLMNHHHHRPLHLAVAVVTRKSATVHIDEQAILVVNFLCLRRLRLTQVVDGANTHIELLSNRIDAFGKRYLRADFPIGSGILCFRRPRVMILWRSPTQISFWCLGVRDALKAVHGDAMGQLFLASHWAQPC
mmetsp:Transcript_12241/g.23046  ORF Transcript_12241/g.23046 Transcript_12241/m.23046 type:complete len:249 (+) Transcript_12241:1504-2250(+)